MAAATGVTTAATGAPVAATDDAPAGLPAAGLPAAGLPATGLPAAGLPAAGLVAAAGLTAVVTMGAAVAIAPTPGFKSPAPSIPIFVVVT